MLEYPLLLVFPAAMIYAAAMDLLTMTIPNRVSLALIGSFMLAAALTGMSWPQFFSHMAAGLAVLAICIVLFARGWIGGGDAKLLAAASVWFGFEHLLQYTILATLLGGVLSVTILAYRHFIPMVWIAGRNWTERLHDPKNGVPYGVALAGAALWLYPSTQMFLALGG